MAHISQITTSIGINLSHPPDVLHKRAQQSNVQYNLAYISQTHRYPERKYSYMDSAGAGVDVYVLDTGIEVSHKDFGVRAFTHTNFIRSEGTTVSSTTMLNLRT